MTGEMYHIDQDGKDDSGNEWTMHAAIAKALRDEGYDATLQPFDQYQGPYILVGKDIRVGNAPYRLAVQNMGVIRLWIVAHDDPVSQIQREDTDTLSESFWWNDTKSAIACAKELLARTKEVTNSFPEDVAKRITKHQEQITRAVDSGKEFVEREQDGR